jgi:hypothetical protein
MENNLKKIKMDDNLKKMEDDLKKKMENNLKKNRRQPKKWKSTSKKHNLKESTIINSKLT